MSTQTRKLNYSSIERIETVSAQLYNLVFRPNPANTSVPSTVVSNIRESILLISKDIEQEYPSFSNRLLELKNTLFSEFPAGFNTVIYINPVVFGQTIELLEVVKGLCIDRETKTNNWCPMIHPKIKRVSEKLYKDGNYANAACDAFIEINDRVKKLFMLRKPNVTNVPDGQDLMNKVFSDNDPVIEACDRSTDTGKNIHKGLRFMLAGAMAALRNPKAHANIQIDREEAMRRLIFASLLMQKIDEAVSYSKIEEQ